MNTTLFTPYQREDRYWTYATMVRLPSLGKLVRGTSGAFMTERAAQLSATLDEREYDLAMAKGKGVEA